jgi:hypothetical protein
MQSRSFTFLFIFASLVISGASAVHAAPQSYEEYQSGATAYCDSDKRPWNTGSTIVPEIDYPQFTTNTVNAAMARWRDGSITINDNEKIRLRRDLDPVTIGEYTGLKTLEVARIMYRTRMNTLFSCGIIGSRIDTVKNLKELIAKKIKNKDSEIYQKLEKEVKKLGESQNKLKCNIEKEDGKKEEMIINIVNSSSHQYCHYRYYLGYLESNTADILSAQNIEQKI